MAGLNISQRNPSTTKLVHQPLSLKELRDKLQMLDCVTNLKWSYQFHIFSFPSSHSKQPQSFRLHYRVYFIRSRRQDRCKARTHIQNKRRWDVPRSFSHR